VTGGLSGMRERAELLGGALTITSAPGAGTTVAARLPLKGRADREDDSGFVI
jgi:signal transduction histidine kinase